MRPCHHSSVADTSTSVVQIVFGSALTLVPFVLVVIGGSAGPGTRGLKKHLNYSQAGGHILLL